jgi:hypothetical protein
MRKAERRWRHIVEAWWESGLSAPAFVQGRGISANSLYIWSGRLKKQGLLSPASTPKLLPVELIEEPCSAPPAELRVLEVLLPRGEVIRVPPGADLTQLGRVVAALHGGPVS